jgi:wyosine [tRNA(Phe)-imidazoG37] synthetase (radical SAM superfamily)
MLSDEAALKAAYADHSRLWQGYRFVYPVISRRAGGLSIGVNLSTNKLCNYACPYCQVDRGVVATGEAPTESEVMRELEALLDAYQKDGLESMFPGVRKEHRLLGDIAFSGDGEPTLSPLFAPLARRIAQMAPCKLTLITNASTAHNPQVEEGIAALCSQNGEVWAKLDAGSEALYRIMSGSHFSIGQILENITYLLNLFPVRVQTMLCEVGGHTWELPEADCYVERIRGLWEEARPGNFCEVQLYTVARHAASGVRAVPAQQLDALAGRLRALLPHLKVGVYA